MRLTTRIMIGVVLVIAIMNGAVFYFIGNKYNSLLLERLVESARSFYKQIVVTRAWVSHYDGVFVKKDPDVKLNPFLKTPAVFTTDGDTLVKRNPALVTRELSELGETMGLFRFHLTSLTPINPQNKPNGFERAALLALQDSSQSKFSTYGEVTKLEDIDDKSYFRYFAPLYTEESCLSCHSKQGYRIGDVRGGISIIISAENFKAAINNNILLLVVGCLLSSTAICLLIYYLIRQTVIKPLRKLEAATENIGHGDYLTQVPIQSNDEIGDLGKAFTRMQEAIQDSMNKQINTEKMVALGQLSAGIAHEIRNPLFAVRNDLDYLKREFPGNGEQNEIYGEMEDGVERINRTVKAILDYSKPHKPEFSRHQISDVIDRCMALMEKQFSKDNVRIHVEIEPGLPHIDYDIHRLEQVLVNLMANAKRAVIAHNEIGIIEVRATQNSGSLQIEVKDNGAGMKQTEINRIFDPFYTRAKDGTGLGLTIVKRIIQQHHGEIQVSSQVGKGTSFIIQLPLNQPKEEA